MKPTKHESKVEPIISDATARFTIILFLALFTIGVALLVWRGFSAVPEGAHWIDHAMGAIRNFSTFAAMLLVLYLVFAAKAFGKRLEDELGLRYQQVISEGRRQAVEGFPPGAGDVWEDWAEWKELAETARREGRPEPQPPPRPLTPPDLTALPRVGDGGTC